MSSAINGGCLFAADPEKAFDRQAIFWAPEALSTVLSLQEADASGETGPVGILTGLDADRQAAKGAEGQEPVGSMREVGARNSSLYSFVMVIRVVGNGI